MPLSDFLKYAVKVALALICRGGREGHHKPIEVASYSEVYSLADYLTEAINLL